MKHLHSFSKIAMIVTLLWLLAIVACDEKKEDPVPDPDEIVAGDDIVLKTGEANKVTQSIKLKNGSVIKGKIPSFPVVADLKIDHDTIFWVKGVKVRIRIKKASQIHYGSLTMQVANSDTYIKAEFEEEEETDSTAVFYFEFEEEPEWDPPLSFNIKIVPEDENGVPQDSISVPVEVEEPIANSGNGCGFENYWEWMYNERDGKIDFTFRKMATISNVKGCCIEGKSVYSGSSWICPTEQQRSVEYVAVFGLEVDYLLFSNGMAFGGMAQYTQNLNVGTTDFCALNPGYNIRTTINEYESAYTVNGGNCTLTIAGFEGKSEPIYDDDGNYYGEAPLPIYAGSGYGSEYTLISKHYMMETRNMEGTSFLRYYRAPFDKINGVPNTDEVSWYD